MAVVFVNEEDRRIFKELVLVLKTAGAPIPREIANSRYTTSVYVGRERKRKLSSSFSLLTNMCERVVLSFLK